MPSAVLTIQWDSYAGNADSPALFSTDLLTYNCRQSRLHDLVPGDRLWLVSRSPDDRQYYFVGVLTVASHKTNPAGSREVEQFGEYAVVADRSRSHDLGRRFPAEGLLRALVFQTDKPIKHGANLGQSLQTLRFLSPLDEQVLAATLDRILADGARAIDAPFGLWTKCDRFFADYFLKDWAARRQPQAFLLYDSPPVLTPGAPIFIHSDQHLRLVARFRESQYVAGHRFTVEEPERVTERERIWTTWRAETLEPETKTDFDTFWTKQHGVRSLFVMDEVTPLNPPSRFKTYARALEWGYPTGVGYRYLSLSQSWLLLRECEESAFSFFEPLLTHSWSLH